MMDRQTIPMAVDRHWAASAAGDQLAGKCTGTFKITKSNQSLQQTSAACL
jgi:hypothetical protein